MRHPAFMLATCGALSLASLPGWAAAMDGRALDQPLCASPPCNSVISPKAAEPVVPGAADKMPKAIAPGTNDQMPASKAPGTTDNPMVKPEQKGEMAK